MKTHFCPAPLAALLFGAILLTCNLSPAAGGYQVFVSNERAGNLTVINGADFKVTGTIPVGNRPRGIHASPDGRTVYVALSGTPVSGPPKLDANGNRIPEKKPADDDNFEPDKSADGIGLVDVASEMFLRKIPAGSDPEQFSLSADGKQLYVSNEDAGTASVLDIASGKVAHTVPVGLEPEGVATRPDGKVFYVTCESTGEVYVVDPQAGRAITHFTVGGRPRSAEFLADGSRAFIPSESSGELHVIDAVNHQRLQTLALPKDSRPMCVKVAPDGKKIYVSTGRGGTVCVFDVKALGLRGAIKVGARPWGIAISPDGKFLFAANGLSDDVSVVDLATEQEVARVKSAGGPWGVVIVPDAK